MKGNEFLRTIAVPLAVFAAILMFVANAIAAGPTERVIYRFKGSNDGSAPSATLLADKAGNLYGTTTAGGAGECQGGCGTIFELSPLRGRSLDRDCPLPLHRRQRRSLSPGWPDLRRRG
jgi:uncharacterized repeat protein (TIGR03803 family)